MNSFLENRIGYLIESVDRVQCNSIRLRIGFLSSFIFIDVGSVINLQLLYTVSIATGPGLNLT